MPNFVANTIVQVASEMDVPRSRRDDGSGSISFKALDAAMLDALIFDAASRI